MSEQEIEQNNKLIAEFLEWKQSPNDEQIWEPLYNEIDSKIPMSAPYTNNLYFDKSWDWLMPVVEKIGQLNDGIRVTIKIGTGCTDSFSSCNIKYDNKTINTPYFGEEDGSEGLLYGLYKTVIEFIKWYNNDN